MKEAIFTLKEREQAKQQHIEELKKFINQKQNDINLCTSLLNMKRDTLIKKQEKLDIDKLVT
jgi:hypothetical protein